MATLTTETVRVTLPSDIVELYQEQAKGRGNNPVEWLMAERLRQFADVNSQKPIVISDNLRQHLERLIGRNVSSADALVSAMTKALTASINGIDISVKPQVLERLKSRCIGMDFEKFMIQTVTRALEEVAGLR